MAKLNKQQKVEIKEKYEAGGITIRGLADEYGVGATTISRIIYPEYAEKERESLKNRTDVSSKEKSAKTYAVRFHSEKDAALLEKLESVDNITDYIRGLVREDIGGKENG